MGDAEYKDCPYCGDENLAGARACGCGYRFDGYREAELAAIDEAEEDLARRRRPFHLIGGGLIALGVLLSVASFAAAEGGGRYFVFTGLIVVGVMVLLRRPSSGV